MTATVLWIDDRSHKYEGQVLGNDGKRYFFNWSTCSCKPQRGQIVRVVVDNEYPQGVFIVELLNLKFKGVS